jgi:hypothetical protein
MRYWKNNTTNYNTKHLAKENRRSTHPHSKKSRNWRFYTLRVSTSNLISKV